MDHIQDGFTAMTVWLQAVTITNRCICRYINIHTVTEVPRGTAGMEIHTTICNLIL